MSCQHYSVRFLSDKHPKHSYVMGLKFAHFLEIYLRMIAVAIRNVAASYDLITPAPTYRTALTFGLRLYNNLIPNTSPTLESAHLQSCQASAGRAMAPRNHILVWFSDFVSYANKMRHNKNDIETETSKAKGETKTERKLS